MKNYLRVIYVQCKAIHNCRKKRFFMDELKENKNTKEKSIRRVRFLAEDKGKTI